MKALVTGGAGFIGHHLVRALLARGDAVNVIDDFSSGSGTRLAPFGDRITLIEGSILDGAALDDAMSSCDLIFHEAAIPSVPRSIVTPLLTNEANVAGTVQVMLAAARNGVSRVVFAGSSSVYGVPERLPCVETQRAAPTSPYGVSKLAAEHYVHVLGSLHGIATVVLRYFNVFGPGQDPKSTYAAVIPRFVTAVLAGERPTINGKGDVSRDFTYIENVVSANLLAAADTAPAGTTCNVACGERYTLLELLGAICDAAGKKVEPIFGPARAGDILHSQADITLARTMLGYDVKVPFGEGVARTVAWYRSEAAPVVAGAGSNPNRT